VYEHTASGTAFFKSRIAWNGNGWTLDLKDGSRISFREGFGAGRPAQSGATRIQDRYGNALTLTRNGDADLTQITSPNGRWIALTYDTSHRVTEARDNLNRVVQYTYDASGRLWKVTDVRSGVTTYLYDAAALAHDQRPPRHRLSHQ
jgi:YD repeat-containing protein